MTTPTITDNEVVFTGVATVDSLSISCSITNYNDAVVDLVSGVTAAEEIFCHDSRVVRAHHTSGSNTSTDGLLLEHDSKIVIGSSIVFSVAYVTKSSMFQGPSTVDITSILLSSIWSVIIFFEDTILANVFISFVHPSSSTCVVTFITI
jgi:hypothetical protein